MDLSNALTLAESLLREHGLDDWRVRFDRAKTRAGACQFRERQISLSAHLTGLHPEAEVRDTILHEIAHALVGPAHGHDEVWRAAALRIGCTGRRCTAADVPRLEGPWAGTCPAGHVVRRHRRPVSVQSCGRCPGPPIGNILTWTYRGRTAPMYPNYVAELEALRAGAPDKAPGRLRTGTVVRVIEPGEFQGMVGPILKRGRSRYHVRVRAGVLTVPFALVEPAG